MDSWLLRTALGLSLALDRSGDTIAGMNVLDKNSIIANIAIIRITPS
jgi:hypothetical protein